MHLRVDYSDDDTLITGLITAATEYLDGWNGVLGRALAEQKWRQDFDAFARCLPLPLGPVSAIDSVTWRDADGQESTVNSDDYSLMRDKGGGAHVRFKNDFTAPSDLDEFAAVSVTYTAGGDVPAPIKQAMLLLIGNWYENREEVVIGVSAIKLPAAADALLASFRPLRV